MRVKLICCLFISTHVLGSIGAAAQEDQQWATHKVNESPLRHEWVTIRNGDRELKAIIVYPEKRRDGPIVLIGHEVFGMTDSTINTAIQIAQMGYVTIAPDFLSGHVSIGDGSSSIKKRSHSDLSAELDDAAVDSDFNSWIHYANKMPQSNGKIAIVGLSWGGGAAFRYAAGPHVDSSLKAIFVFYDVGPPVTTQGIFHNAKSAGVFQVHPFVTPVFGFYASNDNRVERTLQLTKDAMNNAGNHYEPIVYHDADHGFMRLGDDPDNTNPANKDAMKASLLRLSQQLAKLQR